mgnify:CR=1 FL=1
MRLILTLLAVFSITLSNYALSSQLSEKSSSTKHEDAIEAVDSLLDALHEAGRFHGAVAVGLNDDIIYAAGFGQANRNRNVVNTPETQFLIGSLTKQFTAALVLRLVHDGTVALNEPISAYLPNYVGPGKNRITLHHLLAHRSGISSFADVRSAAGGETNASPLDFEPGTQYAYSNAGYILLGLVVETVTGRTYDEVLRERILQPAGINNSIGYPSTDARDKLAAGYVDTWWSWGYRRATTVSPDGPFSAGALYATPKALVHWTRELHGGAVLPDSLVETMATPYSDSGYGYGLFVEKETIPGTGSIKITHHGGGINGFTAALRRIHQEDGDTIIIAALDNTQGDETVDITERIRHLLTGSASSRN